MIELERDTVAGRTEADLRTRSRRSRVSRARSSPEPDRRVRGDRPTSCRGEPDGAGRSGRPTLVGHRCRVELNGTMNWSRRHGCICPRDECWSLLERHTVARLAVDIGGQPDIFPINYLVDDRSRSCSGRGPAPSWPAPCSAVTWRSRSTGSTTTSRCGASSSRGWPTRSRAWQQRWDADDLPLYPWIASEKPNFVRIEPRLTTGRRFHVADGVTESSGDAGPLGHRPAVSSAAERAPPRRTEDPARLIPSPTTIRLISPERRCSHPPTPRASSTTSVGALRSSCPSRTASPPRRWTRSRPTQTTSTESACTRCTRIHDRPYLQR